MYYDPTHPVAVFLGPSLPRARAERVLPANYYPPVRRGDIYRLLGSGVRVIVIIDGVFHFTTPVWPREIAAALAMGIVVIGASSMGALRAAELHQLGMIGVGEVFDAYRSGRIDGDDEVAVMHADEEHGYRAQSEPMVNVRHNVARAVERGLLDRNTANEALASVKLSFFGERSYEALLHSRPLQALAPPAMARFRSFLTSESEDLKERDALAALEEGRRQLAGWTAPGTGGARAHRGNGFGLLELLDRGVWRTDGHLVPIRAVVEHAVTSNRLDAAQLREVVAGFYLDRWLDSHPSAVPGDVAAAIDREADVAVDADRLRRIGMTATELRASSVRRARHAWLLQQAPERFGIDFSAQRRCLRPMLAKAWSPAPLHVDDAWIAEVEGQARRSALVTRWALAQGIVCPESQVKGFIERWEQAEGIPDRGFVARALGLTDDEYLRLWGERACYHWLLDKGPVFFGLESFSLEAALVHEWQLSGAIAALAMDVPA